MKDFDLNSFLGSRDLSPTHGDKSCVSAPFDRHLQYLEDDIPEAAFPKVEELAARGDASGRPYRYLQGLACLHRNEPQAAAAHFAAASDDWPRAVNPRLHYVIAAYESNPPLDSEMAYRRVFHVRTLASSFPDSQHLKAMALLSSAVEAMACGERFTGLNLVQEAESMSSGFYPNPLLAMKAYASMGRSAVSDAGVERNRAELVARFPRLAGLGPALYRIVD